MMYRSIACAVVGCLPLALLPGATANAQDIYEQINLVSDVSGLASNTDANLKNPWGVAVSDTSTFCIANNVTGVATLYNASGVPQPLVVTVPGGSPTGVVFNRTSDFALSTGGKSVFLFATLGGGIAGWNPSTGATAEVRALTPDAKYTGLAIAETSQRGNLLYAANSADARIDVFDSAFSPVSLPGAFIDPNLPAGFSPYNIARLYQSLYVTYRNETSGGGLINQFDYDGKLARRIHYSPAGGLLDSPWGLAYPPGTWGGGVMVGNEGDGHISVFSPIDGEFQHQFELPNGAPVAIPGIRGLAFEKTGAADEVDSIYFAAGINNETGGLFGRLKRIPEPGAALLAVELLLLSQLVLPQRQGRCTS